MDVEHPYAADAARLQLLYRLPTAPAPQRLLIVCRQASDALLGLAWPGQVSVAGLAELDALLAQGAGRFDAVALPAVLGVCDIQMPGAHPPIGNRQMLAGVRRLLVPGGTVVGHMEHGWALRRAVQRRGLRDLACAWRKPDAISHPEACLRLLAGTGFSAAECFYVQPNIDAPMGLIPSHPVAAKAQFLRAIRASKHGYSRAGHGLRLSMALVGWGGSFQSHLFFWAHKPC